MDHRLLLPVLGIIGGIALGYIARRNFFCTLSALERLWYSEESNGLRTWILSGLSAAVFTQVLIASSAIDISASFYLAETFNPVATIVGGLAFGFGMALVGTCGFGALIRLGSGSLKSLIAVLVLGLTAMSVQRGFLSFLRLDQAEVLQLPLPSGANQSIPSLLDAVLFPGAGPWLTAAVLLAGFLWVFRSSNFRADRSSIFTGLSIGGVITFGWVATSWVAGRSFEPVQIESASFVAPVSDTIFQYALDIGIVPDYGVGMVIGCIVGAAIAAKLGQGMEWEACDDVPELIRHFCGAMMMGFGGILSVGCTIGQGISAASLLTISAPLTVLSIIVGARMGLAFLLEGSAFDPFIRR